MHPCLTPDFKEISVTSSGFYATTEFIIHCLENIDEFIRDSVVSEYFPHRQPVNAVEGFFEVDKIYA